MSKPAVTYPDPERAVVDRLTAWLAAEGESVTVAVGVPDTWTPASLPHLSVAWDGTPLHRHPVAEMPTIRVTAWSASPTTAKRLAHLALGLLCAHTGDATIGAVTRLAGPQPARDEATRAELAWFTVRVTVRSNPIP